MNGPFLKLYLILIVIFATTTISYSQVNSTNQDPLAKDMVFSNYVMDSVTKAMLSDSIPVKVYVGFIVDKSGNIKNAATYKIDCKGCDQAKVKHLSREAEKYVQLLPKWEPGRDRRGKLVEVKFQLPVTFTLEPSNKKN